MAKLLLGKEVTAAMNEKLQARVAALKEKGVSPKLAIVRCGENPSDLSYEKGATARAELIGVEVQKFVLPEDVTKEALIAQIEAINADDSIHGCLMFRPLPKHLKADQDEICNHLAARKDVIKIARVLGVRLGTFLDDQDEVGPVVCRKKEAKDAISFSNNAIHSRKHMEYHSLSKSKADRHMEPFIIDVMPTEDTDFVLSSHEGEEFIMVMEGIMEISYGKNTYLLEEGDSIYYDSIVPHHVHAYEGQAAKILAVVYTPI